MYNIKIVYFVYLLPNMWYDIVIEQLSALKKLKLYETASDIFLCAISDNVELDKLKTILDSEYNKIKIVNVFKENVFEYPGIKTIYEISELNENDIILYFHTKGITSNKHDVRINLFKWVIETHEEIISEFNNNPKLEIATAFPNKSGTSYFNFFWVNSEYVRKYCKRPIICDNRFKWEVWLSKNRNTITYSPLLKYEHVKKDEIVEKYNYFKNK